MAAKAFVDIAQLICMDEMVESGNKLEAVCLSGDDPVEIYSENQRFFFSRGLALSYPFL